MAGHPAQAAFPKGWEVEIRYKRIRNIWFRADHRHRVFRISAPTAIRPDDLNRALLSKSGWMASQAARPSAPPLIPSALEDQYQCLVKGRSRTLRIIHRQGRPRVSLEGEEGICLQVAPGTAPEGSARTLIDWHRNQLSQEIETLAAIWQPLLGLFASEFRIRRMTTRWGSCNTRAKRIWINLALACLSPELLEYVLVHELIHLAEPGHTKRFYALLDQALPDGRDRRKTLKTFAPGLS